MARKKIRLPIGVVFFALLLGGNVLLFLPQEKTKKINYFFMRSSSAALNVVPKADNSKKETVPVIKYNRLVKAYTKLKGQMEEMRDINEKLSGFRNKLPEPGPKLVAAKVYMTFIDGQRNELLINKGSSENIMRGQYVLACSGDDASVIGTIKDCSDNISRVQLVTDENHHIKVHISRIGQRGNIDGLLTGNNKLGGKIPKLDRTEYENIKTDDIVYASAIAGLLDAPLPVGTIVEAKHDEKQPLLWDVKVKPIDNYETLKNVAVVVIDMDKLSD